MDDFGSRAGFVGSLLDGEEGLLVLRGDQRSDVAPQVAEHLRALVVAGARHIRVDARGAHGLGAELLPVLGRVQSRLNVRRGMLTVAGLALEPAAPALVA